MVCSNKRWGTICNSNTQANLRTVCWQLGYSGGEQYSQGIVKYHWVSCQFTLQDSDTTTTTTTTIVMCLVDCQCVLHLYPVLTNRVVFLTALTVKATTRKHVLISSVFIAIQVRLSLLLCLCSQRTWRCSAYLSPFLNHSILCGWASETGGWSHGCGGEGWDLLQ